MNDTDIMDDTFWIVSIAGNLVCLLLLVICKDDIIDLIRSWRRGKNKDEQP